jgi:hypothetical protein
VLIMPEGHWRATATPRRLSRRERWFAASALTLLLACAVALAISLGSKSGSSGNGCIDITAAAATGGTELRECGVQARLLCSSVTANPGTGNGVTALLPAACRKAGLPLGH